MKGPTRRSTRAADRAFLQIKGFWPPPGYLGRSPATGETKISHWALLLWLFVVWCVWAVAATLQVGLTNIRDPLPNGQRRGMSVLPVIPLYPVVLWGIALLIDIVRSPWGTRGIFCIHLLFAVVLAVSIVRDAVRLARARKSSH